MTETLLSLGAAILLAAVHVLSRLLRRLQELPRSRFLSFAGGMSLSWAVLRTLPGLGIDQEVLERAAEAEGLSFLREHVYLAVLASVLLFYGMERLAKRSRQVGRDVHGVDRTSAAVFWVQTASFAFLNFLIGYALVGRVERGVVPLALFSLAMVLKFLVNDHALFADHKELYDRVGRWVLVVAVAGGWVTGYLTTLPETGPALLRAFIAGSVLFNMLKEELPAERQSRAWAFIAGAVSYALLLLAVS
ncbi:MAG TPA: hypothetical protein VGR37_22760 [Longimicrobiaceae bacterium]|nr:hypothetical protein [Longimicrobiaceae bacterium]